MTVQVKSSSFFIYYYLIFLRLLLVLLPQTGYIHPDEYFQSLEPLVGKYFNVECSLPWEFNTTFPIRSMTIPYFTIGMCYKFLKDLNNASKEYLSETLLTPYSLLVAPRLIMCAFSFIVDYCLYKICWNNNEKYQSRLIILGSSYVMIVYSTRTFTNTLELVLFSLLLYFVSESLTFSNILLKKREYINFRYEQSKTVVERAKFHKLRLYMESDSFRNCFIISTITVLGFFNRPTFLAFAMIPVFFWLYRGIGSKSVTVLQFHTRMIIFALCSVPSFLLVILVDSFYYGYISWGEIGMLDVTINSFVFSPLNFLKYNLDSGNLAVHGLHPRFLHVLINVPLLFNFLGLYAGASLLNYLYVCYVKKFNLLPSVRSIKCLMTLSFIIPTALLSYFPHQEPRFLIPVIVPLVYLHATNILPEVNTALVEAAPKIHIQGDIKKTKKSYVFKTWLLINTLLTILYGFLHQGGIYPATAYMYRGLKLLPLNTQVHLVTSHLYSLPESFLMQEPSSKLYSMETTPSVVKRRVHLYEEGSKNLELIVKLLKSIVDSQKMKPSERYKIYLLISSSLDDRLAYIVSKQALNMSLVETFYPHVSFEAFPDLLGFYLEISQALYGNTCTVFSFADYVKRVFGAFGVNLYEITGYDLM